MIDMHTCFDCGCSCGVVGAKFDEMAAAEMRTPPSLDDLCRTNIAYYCDRTIDDILVRDWPLTKRSGVYILWHKDEYCDVHQRFHMRALYVGKGAFDARILDHWASKPTADIQLIYFSYLDLPNRIAKYVEQLLLDVYDLPLNVSENRGTATLCAHFTQSEVD
jgi:hypothetical protein